MKSIKPTIIIDTREQTPLKFERYPSKVAGLRTGDYSIEGLEELFAIERKSITDLVGCCCDSNRKRFERELHRLRGYERKRLLIIGSVAEIVGHRYRGNTSPNAVLATLAAFEMRYDVPVVFIPCEIEAAKRVENWAYWYLREFVKTAKKLGAKWEKK